MTADYEDVLTDRELEILSDGVTPFLNRYDVADPPACDHCERAARYALVLGRYPGERGMYVKKICDVCLEQKYRDLDPELRMRMFQEWD